MTKYPAEITATVNLLDAFRGYIEGKNYLSPPKRRKTMQIGYGRDFNHRIIDREMSNIDLLEEKLNRIKYVNEVCFDHMAWVTIYTDTSNFAVAERRYRTTVEKIDRTLRRWAEALPNE